MLYDHEAALRRLAKAENSFTTARAVVFGTLPAGDLGEDRDRDPREVLAERRAQYLGACEARRREDGMLGCLIVGHRCGFAAPSQRAPIGVQTGGVMDHQVDCVERIDRVLSIERHSSTDSTAASGELLLTAFQRVFPSCAGPTIADLGDPSACIRAMRRDASDGVAEGDVECRFAADGYTWVDLVSATSARRLRTHLKRAYGEATVDRVEMILDSRRAAEDVLRYLAANGDPEILVRYRATVATCAVFVGDMVGERGRPSAFLARLSDAS